MSRKRPVRESGFTLLEVLVLLVISTIVMGVVFQLLVGQGQVARLTTAREEVQQNARTSMELISSELRGITPHAIVAAERSMLRFNQPRTWGVLCHDLSVDGPLAMPQIIGRFPAGTLPADARFAAREWGVGVGRMNDPTALPSGYGHFLPQAAAAPGTVCQDRVGAGAGTVEYGAVVRPRVGMAFPFAAAAGARVFLYEEAGYRVNGGWLERMTGYNDGGEPNWQPLAGPLTSENGLEFRYYREDGSEITATPVPTASLATIASVRVSVQTQSTARFADDRRQQNHASTMISLRNR